MSPREQMLMFEFREGGLPPPLDYQYRITLRADGRGDVTMSPDCPGDGVPTWSESFHLGASTVDRLFQIADAGGLPARRWTDRVVGVDGATGALTLTVNGIVDALPTRPLAGSRRLQEVHAALRAAVPVSVWERLAGRRAAYVEARRR